jgi:uncharacterized protein (TIGR03067 family)
MSRKEEAMMLAKWVSGVAVLLVVGTAAAIPIMPFIDTSSWVAKAKDIVLAEALSEALGPGEDGIAPHDVKVVAVIKGERKLGRLRVGTSGLEIGRSYMLTGFGGVVDKIDFITNGELAAIELPPGFDIGTLKGTAVQQVQLILDARRAWVEGQLRVLKAEKVLLDRAGPKGEAKLQGTWKLNEADALGKHLPRETNEQTWVIKDGEIIVRYEDGTTEKWAYTLDPTTTPRCFDLKVVTGVKAGASAKGIYAREGNTLRISFNGDGDRPARFDAAALGHSRWGRRFVLERVTADRSK